MGEPDDVSARAGGTPALGAGAGICGFVGIASSGCDGAGLPNDCDCAGVPKDWDAPGGGAWGAPHGALGVCGGGGAKDCGVAAAGYGSAGVAPGGG
jgi:hypothetical protein